AEWGRMEGMRGKCGLSAVGAVVAPGELSRARVLRGLLPDAVLLVPGFGAQGRSREQVAACFRADGGGALVNSSRGVINAYADANYAPKSPEAWTESVRQACRDLVTAVGNMQSPA
ncbi:MAG TPA: orotidine 5'-phosphate decarboxylase, partial [Phycisphaerae bacterium]|nr:orotidine 5'-phosphate decarboxylase [Phycisphaerae bacterium]